MTLKIIVPPHPLIAHWLSILRTESTPNSIYVTALEELGKWLTYEAIRDWLPCRTEIIKTSLGQTEGSIIESRIPLLAIPNLPGGLQLWNGARNILPNTELSLGGKIPPQIKKNAGIILYFDEISTGDLLIKNLISLKEQNIEPQRIKIISIISSNPGLKKISELFPELTIYAACIDPEITEEGRIIPGIGVTESRINTTISDSFSF